MQKCNFVFKLLSCFRMQKFQGRIVCRRMTAVHLFIIEAQFTAAPPHLFSHHTTIAANCASSLYGESFSRTQLWHSFGAVSPRRGHLFIFAQHMWSPVVVGQRVWHSRAIRCGIHDDRVQPVTNFLILAPDIVSEAENLILP